MRNSQVSDTLSHWMWLNIEVLTLWSTCAQYSLVCWWTNMDVGQWTNWSLWSNTSHSIVLSAPHVSSFINWNISNTDFTCLQSNHFAGITSLRNKCKESRNIFCTFCILKNCYFLFKYSIRTNETLRGLIRLTSFFQQHWTYWEIV